jgi:dTDP-glucose 4,6-dehydratase
MRILITGGAGFIGSNLILYWLRDRPEDQILNLDKLTYAADLKYLESAASNPQYRLLQADISSRAEVAEAVRTFRPEGVIHLAAESHVDNSISGPEPFVQTNLVGTFNLLQECYLLWKQDPRGLAANRFLHVSTDEVYGALGDQGFFTEQTPYAPNSPYSATKAGSDLLVRAYHHTYGMNVVTTNCSNNFGPHQHDEKLIPTVIRSALQGKPIPVYGKGANVRDWLYVGDHCRAIEHAFRKGRPGETYIIGSRNERKNVDLVRLICGVLNERVGKGPQGDYASLISFVTDRLGHDFRYAIDPSKIEAELGWKAVGRFDEHLRETVDWYVRRYTQ